MNSTELRQAFITFFESKGHSFSPPAPIAPEDDPTLLFTNAGMNQFKDVFLGVGKRPYTRAVNSQVCVRVSGKHNDLEDVGRDTTHQTAFEMLGNWSFGDYYKKESIAWAWEFLTEVLKLPKEKLYASVYTEDDESFDLWLSETDITTDRVVKCGKKDNFWEMGETGPCGPCSEIHMDLGPGKCSESGDANHTCEVNGECGRIVELWNLVFIQYNRLASGQLEPLAAKHVDTGAGLERLASTLQGSYSNYQTDLFQPILDQITALTGVAYEDSLSGMPHRVIADHIRTLVIGIADNVMPSNDGRGYVLRRLLRRALKYSQKLSVKGEILYKLVPAVVEIWGEYLPQVKQRQAFITQVIQSEEESFLKTLESGTELFNERIQALKKETKTQISGEDAFKLYDTYGFPLDLTQVMAQEAGLSVDLDGFDRLLAIQKETSRTATKSKQKKDQDSQTTQVTADIFEGQPLFLAEDLNVARGGEARVIDDPLEKLGMARHHTGTHILHEALRRVLGDHVHQAGSLVDSNRLRFDFTHFKALSTEELEQVLKSCNEMIQKNIALSIDFMTLEAAKAKGAMALFGEKYNHDRVRMVQIGDFSTELCGGTHVQSTGLIEGLKILSETGIAAGTRRIEAITGKDLISESNKHDSDQQKLKTEKEANLKAQKEAQKNKQKEQTQQANQEGEAILAERQDLSNGLSILLKKVQGYDAKMLRTLSDTILAKHPKTVLVLASDSDGKGVLLVRLGQSDLSLKAPDLVKTMTAITGGGGGGRDDMAQAGGADPAHFDAALIAVKEQLNSL